MWASIVWQSEVLANILMLASTYIIVSSSVTMLASTYIIVSISHHCEEVSASADWIGARARAVPMIPLSGWTGENLIEPVADGHELKKWYKGGSLLQVFISLVFCSCIPVSVFLSGIRVGGRALATPCTLHPASCTLHRFVRSFLALYSCRRNTSPYTLHPAPYVLHAHTLCPTP
jgi:hypothetical protein